VLARYLFVSSPAQGDARIVDQAGSERKPHRVGIWEPVHVRVRVDAVVAHGDGSGCRRHWARHVRTQRNSVLRLRRWLPVVERPHAGEGGRVRSVGVGCDWVHVLRDRRHSSGRRIGARARVCHGQPGRPGRRLGVGHVWMAEGCRAAVVLRVAADAVGRWGWVRGACNRRVNVRAGVGCQDTICSGLLVVNTGGAPAFAARRMGTAADGGRRVADVRCPRWLCSFQSLVRL
jgi:hypothetical protein